MPRSLRLGFGDAFYHVMSRGRGRQTVFHGSHTMNLTLHPSPSLHPGLPTGLIAVGLSVLLYKSTMQKVLRLHKERKEQLAKEREELKSRVRP